MSRPPVTVRMYRGILGDCFLITVGNPDAPRAERTHILIDCGVLQGVEGGKSRMRVIASDIHETTEGQLDCVVVTHEHFDHISGFRYAWDIFAQMTIGRAWFAWTEDPQDEVARKLAQQFDHAHQALALMQLALAANSGGPEPDDDAECEVGLAGFVGPAERGLGFDGEPSPRGSRAIYARLREKAGDVAYLYPGDVLPTPALHNGAPRLQVFTLGPPRDYDMLKKDLPSAGPAKETYLAAHSAASEPTGEGSPFAPRYRWWNGNGPPPPPDWIEAIYYADKAPCRFHGGKGTPKGHSCVTDFECGARQDYRRIDDMLALEAEGLALKLDSHTNNTSLVLAFELKAGGDVLLFAADAQVGNWLSWDAVTFKHKATGEPEPVTAAQLLARTRLYKVGHHGSHNATMKDQGLERMTHPGLIALISTVEAVAAKQGKGTWKMPNPETYRALVRKTNGRILRGDQTLQELQAQIEADLFEKPPGFQLDATFTPHREDDEVCDVRL